MVGIVDEPVGMPGRKILETGMKDSPAVADDELALILPVTHRFSEVKIGRMAASTVLVVMIGDRAAPAASGYRATSPSAPRSARHRHTSCHGRDDD